MKLSKYIDHTLLKANATKEQIIKLCSEAKEYDFKTVCVNPSYIPLCKEELANSDVMVCTVIGFPLGQMTTEAKVFETKHAIEIGADEVDMVLNIGKLKDQDYTYVTNEIRAIKEACGEHCLKVIIETCLLTNDEKVMACKCILDAGADFVKTSTGFSTSGATFEDVDFTGSNYSSSYGVIYAHETSKVTLNNCDFNLENEIDAVTGAVLKGNDYANDKFVVNNCNFTLNNTYAKITN